MNSVHLLKKITQSSAGIIHDNKVMKKKGNDANWRRKEEKGTYASHENMINESDKQTRDR